MFTAADMTNNAQDENAILNIFRTNVVMIQYSLSTNSAGVKQMRVEAGWGIAPYVAKDSTGTIIDVMSIKNQPGAGTTFSSYWCPYESNDQRMATLSNGADYMFTAKMDGCTFGVGSAAPNGDVSVIHANMGGKGHDQLDLIRGQATFQNDMGLKTLGPTAYRFATGTGGTEATTFGIRLATGQWKFYSQVVMIDKSAKTMELLGVVPVA